jgi:hypothetical protein
MKKKPAKQAFRRVGAPRFELGTSSPPDSHSQVAAVGPRWLNPHNDARLRGVTRPSAAWLRRDGFGRLFPVRSRETVDQEAFRARLGAGCDVVAGSRALSSTPQK